MTRLTHLFEKFGLAGQEPKFKIGDHVERIEGGGEFMVVLSVSKTLDTVLFSCRWFDSQTRQNKVDEFTESQLRFFNWYAANRAAS